MDRRKHYTVTDARATPHYFEPGSHVRFERVSRCGTRYLMRGKGPSGASIVQWLAAEDFTA